MSAQARDGLPFVPDEMWLTSYWGVIESDGSGAWRTVENALPVGHLPAVRIRLVPDVDVVEVQRLRVAGRNLLDALEEAEVDESFNPPTVANLRHYMTALEALVRETS